MYENMTYEYILGRMINRVNDWARGRGIVIDTREGSLIRTALSPAAIELTLMYIELNVILNETFADTASREFLIKRCAERGIIIEPATNAIRQGEFSMDIPLGSRFSLNILNYVAIEKISPGIFKMECETPGNAGNLESGMLIPIDYIDGLEWARLTAVLIPGEDEEGTEHLRQRYFDSLQSQAFGGNIQDYKDKTLAIPGVGAVKVYPVWNGGGTVKIVFLDSIFGVPSSILVDTVQNALDPVPNNGLGLGIAPIGHIVTVAPVNAVTINIQTTITYQSGWDWMTVQGAVVAAIDQYFLELAGSWARADALVVRVSQIEARLLDVIGVIDIQDTELNGTTGNILLGPDDVPKRGVVSG